mmetsp:Transcript_21829/g.65433  ORF Transcript_21829/g.65433 Transcript_21829/m.65433 type:complete len:378 (-) Transcript_21829:61-1194(-)
MTSARGDSAELREAARRGLRLVGLLLEPHLAQAGARLFEAPERVHGRHRGARGFDARQDARAVARGRPPALVVCPGVGQQVLEIRAPRRRDRGPLVALDDARKVRLDVVAAVGLARKAPDLEGGDGPGVDVHLGAVEVPAADLGRHVTARARRPRQIVGRVRVVVVHVQRHRQPKVQELEAPRGVDAEVVGLEVAVHDLLVVQVRERVEEDADQVARLLLVVEGLLHDALEELAALHELDDHVVGALLLEEVVELDDVRVLDVLQHRHLLPQARHVLLLEVRRLLDALDGHLDARGTVRVSLRRQHDAREGARAELLGVVELVGLVELRVGVLAAAAASRRLGRGAPHVGGLRLRRGDDKVRLRLRRVQAASHAGLG